MTQQSVKCNSKEYILIRGAASHNLKAIDVAIPRNKLVVITGLSGSGKSTLAFDTLYAEGQRRYVESLSSYARQFLGRLNKPKVTSIKGIAPAIAIEQKVNTSNPRSTVGTSTEIYDYLKLLFARIGKTFSPVSGAEVKKHSVSDVIDFVKTLEEGTKMLLLAPVHITGERSVKEILNILSQQGYSRIQYKNKALRIDALDSEVTGDFHLVVDRIRVRHEEDFYNRLADSVQTAFFEGKGYCLLQTADAEKSYSFNNKFELDGISFSEPVTHLFSFNNPYGACPVCEGYGSIIGIDSDRVIPDTALSIFEGAVAPWRGESMRKYNDRLIQHAYKFDFPIHKPYFELSEAQKELLWEGNAYFEGINTFFKYLEKKSYKIQYRVMLSRYRGKTKCPHCRGTRLRKEARYVKVGGKPITEMVGMPLDELLLFFKDITLTDFETKVAVRLLHEIKTRLQFLADVGLSYLTLNRTSATLSGGESQRINLATSLGSSLVGSMYILDEPGVGLHPRDIGRLIKVLRALRDLGNTVIVVEHNENVIKAADTIIDIGPGAGSLGGSVVAEGTFEEVVKQQSLTAQYLNGTRRIEIPSVRRDVKKYIKVEGARENNLKNITVCFPINMLTVVSGVSGSGKSSLVKNILYPAMQKRLDDYGNKPGQHSRISGNIESIAHIEFVNQNPIGRSSRSNPVTYIKAYDDIRNLFASQKLSKIRGYKAGYFSFNIDGGRCEMCKGEGEVTVEMQFMADVHLRCEACNGKRFKKEVLEVCFQGANIHDILSMTIDDAITFFEQHDQNKIAAKLKPLQNVGLGYVQLGQSSGTLSGGEAQRIKLASFLIKGDNHGNTMFIFDEPTTGLHFHDVKKLLNSFNALIEKGHTVIAVSHNLDLIKSADRVIDLGREGGKKGGNLIFEGTPEALTECEESYTGAYLKEKL